MRIRPFLSSLLLVLVALLACGGPTVGDDGAVRAPVYGDAFWQHWGDGKAEIASYDLVFPRYGAARRGTAVAVFVTEPFSALARVKADPGRHPDSDVFQVLKLNLIRDFATGIYDYNTMLSTFVALEPTDEVAAGSPAKVSFSSQEWCGHVYHQLLPDRGGVREQLHSYFDDEGDRDARLERPADGLLEDALFHWARGLAAPALAPGETRRVPLLISLVRSRLRHVPLRWVSAALSRDPQPLRVEVPAGTFEVDRLAVDVAGERSWTFLVEHAAPHRLVRWESSEGERAELVAVERLSYWKMNGPDDVEALARIGLQRRPPRTP